MTTTEILEDLKNCGLKIRIDGCDLIVNGSEPIAPDLIETLRKNKAEILQTLKSENHEFTAQLKQSGLSEKWQVYLLERVGILVGHENYSLEDARSEVLKMISYYRELN